MDLESVTLKLPRELLSGAQRVATARDVTIGHLVRHLLKREVDRQSSQGAVAKPDQRLVTALQSLLARDVQNARSWQDLVARLRMHGYALHPCNDDMVLIKISCGTRVCSGAVLGFDYAALVERFDGPLPMAQEKPVTGSGVMPAGKIDPTRHAMLCRQFTAARNWPDLINRLAIEGMELRPTGAEIGIHIAATGRHLCNGSAVGAPYAQLVKRFGAPLPGHPCNLGSQAMNLATGE
ncbi:hypothetical protein OS189_05010 [Sulfitobacter sp. F26169L]|uniref:hypothetical protein n=1 Tax=Sulfitobacter sp. F26169L TaxID=2996015 RepID=UPI0022609297|nr:hypothetical protein [Sulfitobacter sp. F26169L]MCX7565696.1 hypothetical protein [Sulfitobacter sp. F26169L]